MLRRPYYFFFKIRNKAATSSNRSRPALLCTPEILSRMWARKISMTHSSSTATSSRSSSCPRSGRHSSNSRTLTRPSIVLTMPLNRAFIYAVRPPTLTIQVIKKLQNKQIESKSYETTFQYQKIDMMKL